MKKIIAKGMAAFLMVLMALTLLAPICHAAEEDGNYSVEVHFTHTPVKVEVNEDTWILTMKNQSKEKICNAYVQMTVGDFSVKSKKFSVSGLETYEVELKNYLDEEFLKENDVKIDVYGETVGKSIIKYIIIIIFPIIFLFILICL